MQSIKRLVIVGGGTAGWMAAASLAKNFKGADLRITLIESPDIGTVGVGEATIPTIRRFYADLGLSDDQVLKATEGTCKLGIRFVDWHKQGVDYFHPFGLFGQDIKHVGFQHFWKKMSDYPDVGDIAQYSLCVQLAMNNKFALPSGSPQSPLSVFDWALHFDAAKFAKLMMEVAVAAGVEHVRNTIDAVNLRDSDGFIDHLVLADGTRVDGDLFIDCSGFSGLLIEKALKTGFEDWSHWLKCDRAIAVQSENGSQDFPPYTTSTARSAGWQWKIPLRHRAGNGYVYSSQYISDDEALAELKKNVSAPWLTEPKTIRFKAGRRLKAWNKNCVAIGLASGFLEPLESTSIAFIENAILRLKMLFPDMSFNPSCIDEFNEMSRLEFETCRDFIILHYQASARDDTPFWRDCTAMTLPDRLAHKVSVYQSRGHLVKYRWEVFQNPSWIAIYHGNGIVPQSVDGMTANYDVEYLRQAFQGMKNAIASAVAAAPKHSDYLKQFI